ncbi:rCG61741 [Rattus norvegicus]|uniref:RCG61741 n=1 Tax=Rattus norvegicus TaxID=10116 RepID=A6HCH7_RAT|nr:rCG61741 [Rattus norvegicus]
MAESLPSHLLYQGTSTLILLYTPDWTESHNPPASVTRVLQL